MAAGRQSGGGSPRIDWGAALAFYLELGPERSYEKVSKKFSVSPGAVGKHARADDWPRQAAEFDRKAAAGAMTRLVRSREERIAKILGVADLTTDRAEQFLQGDDSKRPAFERLSETIKLAELLSGEATSRPSFEELQGALRIVVAVAAKYVPKSKRAAFVVEVNEAMGGQA